MTASMRKSNRVGLDLTTGPILKSLLVFAVPIVLANLIQQLYSMVDLLVIGQFMGSNGTVGVSTGGEISDLMTPIATSFATAGQIYIAQLTGAKEQGKVKTAIGTLITSMMILSMIFTVLTVVFHRQILEILNCPEEAMDQAINYMLITAVGLPFIFGYNAICGALRGLGESKRPMFFIIIASVINIVLDIPLVAVFHLEAAGTAIATVFSQAGSCIAALIYIYKNREQFDFELKLSYFRMDRRDMRVLLSLGIPQALRSTLVRFSMLWVNASVNDYGLVASATNSIGNKLQKFLDVFSSGVSQASAAMVGQNLGARDHKRAQKVVWYSLGVCVAVACLITALIVFFPRQIYGIFSTDTAVIDLGVVYLHIMIIHFFMSAITSSLQSMVIGSGYASMNFVIGILDGIVCKIGFSLLFAVVLSMGITGYFWGTTLSRVIPSIICLVYMLSGKWKTRKLLSEA